MDSRSLADIYSLSPNEEADVAHAYSVIRRSTAPFMVSIAADMLDDLRRESSKSTNDRIVFVGRDGHSLAVAVSVLDPEFFKKKCSVVVLSRAVVDAALQDQEKNLGRRFPQVEAFRGARKKVSPETVDGASMRLTKYLRGKGVPVGKPDSSVTLVDTSFKGTVQELLKAAYPKTAFQGKYAFFSESPDDPNPGTKVGYVFHKNAGAEWKGFPSATLPEEFADTFGSQDALGVIEETMHGPLDSPKSVTESGPVQISQAEVKDPTEGINPVLVKSEYSSPRVRAAIKHSALKAVEDSALEVVHKRDAGENWKGYLHGQRQKFTQDVRDWVEKKPEVNPDLKGILDSFVRRGDKGQVKELALELKGKGESADSVKPIWREFDKKEMGEKAEFVASIKKMEGRFLGGGGGAEKTGAPSEITKMKTGKSGKKIHISGKENKSHNFDFDSLNKNQNKGRGKGRKP